MRKQGLQLQGDKALERNLKSLGDKVARKVLRQAVNAGINPVVKSARAKAPRESGLLGKSIGKKTKMYKARGVAVAVAGPRTNIEGEYQGKVRKPKFYAHLVERGHVNSDGSFTAPKPFLEPAFAETHTQAVNIMRDKLAEGVIREAAKAKGGAKT